jgi:hypothetical protein
MSGLLAYFGGTLRKLTHHRESAHELFRHTSPHGGAPTAVGLKVTYDNEGLTGRRLLVGRRPHEDSAKKGCLTTHCSSPGIQPPRRCTRSVRPSTVPDITLHT